MTPNLMPCPHCGYPPIFENTVTEAVVRCRVCSVTMIAKHKPKGDHHGIQEVESRWNNRAPVPEGGRSGWRHYSSELPDGAPVTPGTTVYAFDSGEGHWEYDLPPLPQVGKE